MVKILFYKANNSKANWIDKLISWKTRGPYSHCEIYFTNSRQTFSINIDKDAKFKGMMNIDSKVWDSIDIDVNGDYLYRVCEKYKGSKYDLIGIIFNFIIPINKQDRKKFFCSELIIKVLQECYYDKLLGVTPHKTTPNKLYRILKG